MTDALREAAKAALDKLECALGWSNSRQYTIPERVRDLILDAGLILRAALAEPAERTYTRAVEARVDAMRQSSAFAASAADALLAENQRLQDALRWIPCSERVPKQGEVVAVWVADWGSYCGAWDSAFGWIAYGCDEFAEVTYWMPLPAAPSAEGTDGIFTCAEVNDA
jgi:hypothetical protein